MKPTVISQDTPLGRNPFAAAPAYGETWLMVAIVMLFVVTLGGWWGWCCLMPRRGAYFRTHCCTGC